MYTQLVEDCRRRDREAMRRLYEATAPMALGVCMRYCGDRETAQDLMQDGYVRIFEGIGRLREPERLMAWVYQVMVNVCLTHCKWREETVSLDEMEKEHIRRTLDRCHGNLTQAAELLGITRQTLYNKMRRL